MSKLTVLNKEGKEKETVDLPDEIFESHVNTDVIHQSVVMYQASLRQGNASTKERGSVSGGGKKPFRQKGTGRARAGSTRSPLWKGGGVVFGPHPRDFSYTVPKKIRKRALVEGLKSKYKDQQLFCIEDLIGPFAKTKEFAIILKCLNLKGRTLGLLDGSDSSVALASRNIKDFDLMRVQDVNAYDLLRFKNILVSQTALNELLKRMQQ